MNRPFGAGPDLVAKARFRHTDPGQPEAAWLGDPHWDTCPVLDLQQLAAVHPEVLVLSAHPDDETLGVGALIAALARHGASITVLVATAGERSHPEATTWTPADLAAQRRGEVERAVAELDSRAGVRHLHLPDGELTAQQDELVEHILPELTPATLVLAPWTDDGHPDHDALGRAARQAGAAAGCRVLHYPIWLWHWCPPTDAPWQLFRVIEPEIADLRCKRDALARFRSQTDPLGPLPGDGAVITDVALARAHRLVEVLLDPAEPQLPLPYAGSTAAARTATFDAMFDLGDDPWDFTDSFYEERKRSLTLAMLGRRHYQRVLEVGCATGQLARTLAGRADHVTALDTSARALAVARRAAGEPATGDPTAETQGTTITWVHGRAPGDLPVGPFDLVVLSEIGYFLTPMELLTTLRRAQEILCPEGELVLVHWRHATRDIPLDGELVHTQAQHALALPTRAHYADEDLRIDVWGAPLSVAAVEDRR